MILVAGGTGRLGREVVRRFTARGQPVRVLTRDPARAAALWNAPVEVVAGKVQDPEAVARAVQGVQTVVSAIQGMTGRGLDSPRTVDDQGNVNLIRAAGRAGVGHFVLISVQGAAPEHPLELFRVKYRAEQELRASGLPWTIIRPTAFMEMWAQLVGEPLVRTGRTVIFGRGLNPINFVSAHDVARLVELAVTDPAWRGTVVEIGGPENLSFQQVVETFEQVTGRRGRMRRMPLPLLRVMAALMPRINPALARQIQAAVMMDTADMSFGPPAGLPVPLTPLAEVVRRDYGEF